MKHLPRRFDRFSRDSARDTSGPPISATQGAPGQESSTTDQPGTGSADSGRPRTYRTSQLVTLLLGPALFVLTMLVVRVDGLETPAVAVLGATLWMGTWWIGECVPLPVTALIPILIFPTVGALETGEAFSSYGDNIIFLFMGGFLIAIALEKWGLHRRIALSIVRVLGTSVQRIILGFILATGVVSIWITNTATAMMMIPMGTAIVAQVRDMQRESSRASEEDVAKFEKSLIYGIGYSATIAGVGTLIGGTTIPVMVAQAEALVGQTVSFAQYALFGIPFVLCFMLLLWVYLTRIAFRTKMRTLPAGATVINQELKAMGPMTKPEKRIAAIGLLTALLWMTRPWLIDPFVEGISDGMIAILAAVLLFLVPAGDAEKTRVLEWRDTSRLPWDILLLFGGGLALAAAFTSTGLSEWVGDKFSLLGAAPFLVIVLVTAAILVYFTEFTSTTATALVFVPLVGAGAMSIGQDAVILMLTAALAVNCAFMLPVATPPNAIMYSTRVVTASGLLKTGFWLSLIGIGLITVFVTVWAPFVFSL
ncbi:sodium-dependent dicarboxylate transporter 2/3/5 [Tamaricihabitans halophyticus]|uniref:Sodium-dependent dicarboxylate transporter SdcS n=1 Tax=Tamaricihabitans halophyticus TaxID=1262583 RepID=A0A4R2QMX2_9PSEU|nr:DASS family sodium-coupled anion symporter [Tamaricihabitans halophyticus]TCP49928.1 sodium-dependent dicarboxylate transporter 2/3/5 [Tamaricihabitans halophyticus]